MCASNVECFVLRPRSSACNNNSTIITNLPIKGNIVCSRIKHTERRRDREWDAYANETSTVHGWMSLEPPSHGIFGHFMTWLFYLWMNDACIYDDDGDWLQLDVWLTVYRISLIFRLSIVNPFFSLFYSISISVPRRWEWWIASAHSLLTVFFKYLAWAGCYPGNSKMMSCFCFNCASRVVHEKLSQFPVVIVVIYIGHRPFQRIYYEEQTSEPNGANKRKRNKAKVLSIPFE